MNLSFPKLTDQLSNEAKPPQLHFASKYFLDNQKLNKREYHGFSSSENAEKEYQELISNSKKNSLVDITSETLKYEYTKKLNYLNGGLKHIFIISILCLIHCIIEMKYLGHEDLNIATLIISAISISIIFLLLLNIQTKILVDIYGYVSFYLFSMIESFILLSLYTLKVVNFIIVFNRLNGRESCRNRFRCPGYFVYLLLLVCNIVIFVGIFTCAKFTFILFYDAFNVLIKKRKTFAQRQIEINEKNPKNGKIEFVEENDSINNSMYKLNSNDYLKAE